MTDFIIYFIIIIIIIIIIINYYSYLFITIKYRWGNSTPRLASVSKQLSDLSKNFHCDQQAINVIISIFAQICIFSVTKNEFQWS